jgi:hypothetical protein
VRRLYHASTLPYSVLADKGGTIAFAHSGYRAGEEALLEEELVKVLPEPVEEVPAEPGDEDSAVEEEQEPEPAPAEQEP